MPYHKDQEKETSVVWTCGKDGGRKTANCSLKWPRVWKETRRGRKRKEKQREEKEDFDGQCQGRPE